jgi:hypothetical protein
MMKRTLYTFLAAAAISTPAMIAPALVTPAAAQVGVNVNIGLPAMPMPFEAVPMSQPSYLANTGYWQGGGEHRYWERGRWAERNHWADRGHEGRRFEERRHEERHGWNEHRH